MTQATLHASPVYDAEAVVRLLAIPYSVEDIAAFGRPPVALADFITFFDPGWSILRLRDAVAGKKILYPQDWYDNEAFAKFEEEPRYRQLRMQAVKDSFGTTLAELRARLTGEEETRVRRWRILVESAELKEAA